MKPIIISFLLIVTIFCFSAEKKEKTFINAKYGYRFLYSDDLEVILTGKKKERDGCRISIYRYENAAPIPHLDIIVSPKQLLENDTLLKAKDNKQFFIKSRNILINQKKIKVYEFIFKENNRIFMTQLYINGVKIVYMSSPSGEKFDETNFFKIITTFKINK